MVEQIKAPTSVTSGDGDWSKTGAATTVDCTKSPSASPDDSKYISNAGGSPIRVKLVAADHPNQVAGLVIRARARSSEAFTLPDLTLRAYAGAVLVTEQSFSVAAVFDTYEYELNDSEAASIPDFADVDLEVESNYQLDVSVLEGQWPAHVLKACVIG